MTPDSMDSYRQMAADITEIKVAVGRLETKISTLCQQRVEQHAEHVHCQADIHKRLDEHDDEISTLNTRWKVATGLVSALITVLTILNILLSIGVRL